MSVVRRVRGERGSVAITGLLFAAALIVMVGTGVDIAHSFILRRDLTAIADNAALVASQRIDVDAWREGRLALDATQAEQAAEAELAAEPDVSGDAAAEGSSVTVVARRRFPTLMLRLVGINELTISATATAEPRQP